MKKTVRVGVLDAYPLLAHGFTALLRDAGFEVVITVTTWEQLIDHPALPVDVIVLDLHHEDGVLMSTKVREFADSGTAIVATCWRSDATSVLTAIRSGARAFVSLVDSPDDLATAVQTAASGGIHLSDERAGILASSTTAAEAGLGRQEERALVLYAAGRSIREVADIMETTDETVKSYIKRARRKYRVVGVDVGTRALLRRHAFDQGWLRGSESHS